MHICLFRITGSPVLQRRGAAASLRQLDPGRPTRRFQ